MTSYFQVHQRIRLGERKKFLPEGPTRRYGSSIVSIRGMETAKKINNKKGTPVRPVRGNLSWRTVKPGIKCVTVLNVYGKK